MPSPPSSHYHQTHSSQARITSSPSSHYRQTSTTSLMILSRRWNTTSRTEAIQSAQRVSNKLISCWDSERVYLRRRDTLVASLEHLLMSPVFLESRTSYCIFVGNRCRYHPWSSFCWCWSPGFGACTGPEASCAALTQYLGCFTAGRRKFHATYQPSTSVQLTLQMNVLSCLRLTARCADIVIHVRREMLYLGADSDVLEQQLSAPIRKLEEYAFFAFLLQTSHISSLDLLNVSTVFWSSSLRSIFGNDIWGDMRSRAISQIAIVLCEMHLHCLP